jgi:hypothetical protein
MKRTQWDRPTEPNRDSSLNRFFMPGVLPPYRSGILLRLPDNLQGAKNFFLHFFDKVNSVRESYGSRDRSKRGS